MDNNSSLLDIFIPPDEYFGDFGFICGFTATRTALTQIKSKFSGDTCRPVLAAFIHPTVESISDIPGLAWIWMSTDKKKRGFSLLHAKVALLGFRQINEEKYIIRLAVCTGNWTEDPLTTSIDLFWSIDLDITNLESHPQECLDVLAAWDFFNWLRESIRSDDTLLRRTYDGIIPGKNLEKKIGKIKKITKNNHAEKLQARFIDTRKDSLIEQVIYRMKSYKPRTKVDRLIIGSGFFESGNNLTSETNIPETIRKKLKNKLNDNASLEIVLNQDACQGIKDIFKDLQQPSRQLPVRLGWKFKRPQSAHHKQNAKLHAKFILLASGTAQKHECSGQIYLGSGNMTIPGFMQKASGTRGNLEAGVVFNLPNGLTWTKPTKEKNVKPNSIYNFLPLSDEAITDNTVIESGPPFEKPTEPNCTPPISYLEWENGQLKCPEDFQLKISIYDIDNKPAELPCAWPNHPPIFVHLVSGDWKIPVISNDSLVRPIPKNMTVEDILATLGSFPIATEVDPEDDFDTENGAHINECVPKECSKKVYAIRRMMELLVPLAQVQSEVVSNDWSRWCRELEENLIAIKEYEKPMINFFRDAGANPIGVLMKEEMRQEKTDVEILHKALRRISEAWGMNEKEHPCMWTSEDISS
jgi:hypothetical protein